VTRWRTAWQFAVSGGVPCRSLIAAVIVGTILNLINQGDALFAGRRLDWAKLLMTYFVPYCVTTYGAVSFRLAAARTGSARLQRNAK
jgi:hypothetical protein